MSLREIEMRDSSMEPFIPSGAILSIAESEAVKSGDFIAVFSDEKKTEYIIRKYTVNSDGTILLQALNPSFDSYTCNPDDLKSVPGICPIVKALIVFPAAKRMPPEPKPFKSFISAASTAPLSSENAALLTFEEAELALKVRRTKMYHMLRSGELKASKVGKLWRIEKSSIQEYLARCQYEK